MATNTYVPDELFVNPPCAKPGSREYSYIMSLPVGIKEIRLTSLKELVNRVRDNVDHVT